MVPFIIVTDHLLTPLCPSLLKILALLSRRDWIPLDRRIQDFLNFLAASYNSKLCRNPHSLVLRSQFGHFDPAIVERWKRTCWSSAQICVIVPSFQSFSVSVLHGRRWKARVHKWWEQMRAFMRLWWVFRQTVGPFVGNWHDIWVCGSVIGVELRGSSLRSRSCSFYRFIVRCCLRIHQIDR